MGQTLSEPETSKESAFCQNDYYKVGSSCMQGWRIHMEDSHTHILSLPDDPGTAFFAVYDGHGGANVAQYAGKHLHKFVTKRPEYGDDLKRALQRGFLDIDEAMLNDESLKEQMAGSTAVAVMVKNDRLYCANAGDSRAIACINGKLDVLSFDHKPNNASELERIKRAGGYVEYNRVNGYLALSRALGDFSLKRNGDKLPEEQVVTAYPDVEERAVSEGFEFMVIACDGIWDVLPSQSVMEFVLTEIAQGIYPQNICENLMTRCLAPDCQMGGIGGDNMTVIIVCFLHGRPYEDLVTRCKEHVAEMNKKASEMFIDHESSFVPEQSSSKASLEENGGSDLTPLSSPEQSPKASPSEKTKQSADGQSSPDEDDTSEELDLK
ncbi:probable protein phosphatase 2C T23F11.1 [Ochlerotatus camptorhynchus]|uniref:probable protein phosphatase 2C T23F11.1 n=1 Tax=Ochlerotatus camptorhynchus TaxID=644619 RepID=UPI0031CF80B0